MEDISFSPLDARLAVALLESATTTGTVEQTHQALAVELGSAREVVSRHLKRFADNGWVTLGRGSLVLTDRDALARLARGSRM